MRKDLTDMQVVFHKFVHQVVIHVSSGHAFELEINHSLLPPSSGIIQWNILNIFIDNFATKTASFTPKAPSLTSLAHININQKTYRLVPPAGFFCFHLHLCFGINFSLLNQLMMLTLILVLF